MRVEASATAAAAMSSSRAVAGRDVRRVGLPRPPSRLPAAAGSARPVTPRPVGSGGASPSSGRPECNWWGAAGRQQQQQQATPRRAKSRGASSRPPPARVLPTGKGNRELVRRALSPPAFAARGVLRRRWSFRPAPSRLRHASAPSPASPRPRAVYYFLLNTDATIQWKVQNLSQPPHPVRELPRPSTAPAPFYCQLINETPARQAKQPNTGTTKRWLAAR
ncbi:hypothetical protein EJB05_11756, partial [Eragrostis curvula]